MSKKKKNKGKNRRFGKNVHRAAERRKEEKIFGYLNLKGIPIFREPAGGKVNLDIVPYIVKEKQHPDYREDDPESAVKGEQWWRRPIQIHRNIGALNETVACPKTIGKKCPICEEKDRQYRDGVASEEVIGKSSFRSLYYVIPRGHKDYDEVVHLWDVSEFCFGDLLNEDLQEDEDLGESFNPEGGNTLTIRFSKEKFGKNEFGKASRITYNKRKEDIDEDVINELEDISKLITIKGADELQELFYEMESGDGEREEEDDKPSTRKKKKDRPSPDFGEDDDEPPFETDEKPKRSKRTKKSKDKDKSKKKDKCPEGFRFGKDFDSYMECDDCEVRKACKKAS